MNPTHDHSTLVTEIQAVDLPFVDGNNYWYVHPTDSYYADTALGKKFAKTVFDALEEHEVALNLLDWIVESQIEHATHRDKNMRSAFWYQIAVAVRNGILYTKKAALEKREPEPLKGGQ